MAEENALVAGRYRLIELLGTGAMGAVWKAEDERLHRIVAIKELLLQGSYGNSQVSGAKNRAMREGRIAARLLHANAIAVFDVVEDSDRPWLVMEYLPSTSLAGLLAQRGTLPPGEVAEIGAQIASALAAAHSVGIVHRDLKPHNVLLGEDGNAKITDFGISRAVGDVTVTATGQVAGTPAFFAPEVARGGDADFRSDVFSLGSTLYNAVEGTPPFGSGDNQMALLHRVGRGEISPPEHAGTLTPVLLRLLARDPDERPTMARAAEELAAVARGESAPTKVEDREAMAAAAAESPAEQESPAAGESPAVAGPLEGPEIPPPPPLPGQDPARKRRRTVVLAGLLLLVIAAGAVTAAVLSSGDNTSPPPAASSSPASPPATSAPAPSSLSTAPPASSSSAPPPSSSAAAPPVTAPADPAAAMVASVYSYYALLPGQLDAAYARLTPRFKQDHTPTFASYQSFWGQMSAVRVSDVAATGSNTVSATVDYTYQTGRQQSERQVYGMVDVGGQWLFDTQH